jgi:hypothetical protein
MKALVLRLLSVVLTFIVGVTAASFKLIVPNNAAQKNSKPNPTVTAPVCPPVIEYPQPSFHSSNLSRIVSMLNQLVETKGKAKTNTFYNRRSQ